MTERGEGFTSSAAVFEWLGRFVNLEQGVMPPSMRPERMQIITRAAGNPEKDIPAIHIAGSKGKGSVTTMISAILEEAGFRVGRYMSPHVEDYRERITLADAFFDEAVYVAAGNRLREIEARLARADGEEHKALLAVSDGGAAEPTFFELLTLYFFLCARLANCNVLVVETGMGGRLDPTNVCATVCSVITGIELEHTDMLGDTIAKIAFEKAGIIKNEAPVLLAAQKHPDGSAALAVFRETAAARNAPLWYLPEFSGIENARVSREGTRWMLRFAPNAPPFAAAVAPALDLQLAIPGAVQAENANIAVCAALAAFTGIRADHIRRALARVAPPARFETLQTNPALVVDGAHTAISVALCAETWVHLYGAGGLLIFGCAAGKDVQAMADILVPKFRRIVITKPGTYKISEPEKIYEVFKRALEQTQPPAVCEIQFIPATDEAIAFALAAARTENLPALGTGSFYMAAEIRNSIHKYTPPPPPILISESEGVAVTITGITGNAPSAAAAPAGARILLAWGDNPLRPRRDVEIHGGCARADFARRDWDASFLAGGGPWRVELELLGKTAPARYRSQTTFAQGCTKITLPFSDFVCVSGQNRATF